MTDELVALPSAWLLAAEAIRRGSLVSIDFTDVEQFVRTSRYHESVQTEALRLLRALMSDGAVSVTGPPSKHARRNARLRAERDGTAVPAWAAIRPRGGVPRDPQEPWCGDPCTRHKNRETCERMRALARHRAAEWGQPEPLWAYVRAPSHGGQERKAHMGPALRRERGMGETWDAKQLHGLPKCPVCHQPTSVVRPCRCQGAS